MHLIDNYITIKVKQHHSVKTKYPHILEELPLVNKLRLMNGSIKKTETNKS